MNKVGYARVSTDDQTLALQLDALRAAGCEVIHKDRLSGAAAHRPGLIAALAACQSGAVLHVWKLDRLGRSMSELISIVDDLKRRGVNLKNADRRVRSHRHDAPGGAVDPRRVRCRRRVRARV